MSNSFKKPTFTPLQQKFIDLWDGDIKATAEKAGMNYGYARLLLTKNNKKSNLIKKAIKAREQTEIRPKNIMSRQDRQSFWSKVSKNEEEKMTDRLRASELLGKSEADFTDKLITIDDKMGEAMKTLARKLDQLSIDELREIAFGTNSPRKKSVQQSG